MNNSMLSDVLSGHAQLIDVRTKDEWDNAHALPAIHMPLQQLISGSLSELDASKTIYIYCQSGNRAGQAAKLLKQKGYEAINIGGLDAWRKAGGEIER